MATMMSRVFHLVNNFFLFWVPLACTILATWHHFVVQGNDESKTLEYRVYEELAVPHYLGNVKKDSGLHDPIHFQGQKYKNSTFKSPIRFHFKSSQLLSSHLDLFRLEETSGDLFVVQRIDRDFICPASHVMLRKSSHRSAECSLTFNVVVKPLQYFKIIKVTVIIIDINDNSPRFQKKKSRLEIVESSPVGSLFLLPTAEDDDDVTFAVQEFQLLSQFNEFELKMAEHADGSVDARLGLIVKLDRETKDHYEVTLIAIDGGRPPRSGSTLIDIIVLDSNDNPPVFEKTLYQIAVAEDSPVGVSLLTVKATDKDVGANADITYVISNDQNLFGLEQQTGRLYLKHALDYEHAKQHRLTVSAFNEDSTEYSQTTMTTVVILVDDVNDNSPQITINLLTSSQEAEVLENAALGLFVAHATVKDADSGSGGDVTCSLGDQSQFRLESLFSNEYKITTSQVFDREVCDTYQVTMTCHDRGSPILSSNKTLFISILDDNDNSPTFDQQLQILSVPEDALVGSQVIVMDAHDDDSGRNGAITYTIEEVTLDEMNSTNSQNRPDKFTINHFSGQVIVRSPLDFETKTKFKFIVRANDGGDPSRSGSSTLILNIVDVNDDPPRFERHDGYAFNTPENCSENSFVGTVRATDKDSSSQFRLIKYSVHDDSGTFKIDPITGDVRTATLVDREQRDVYQFTVVAENVASFDVHPGELYNDFNFKKLSSSTNVTVTVIDINDNIPTFVYPNMSFQSIEIYRNVASYVGSPVVRCHAIDPDEGINSVLRYEIVYGNEDSKFSIDPVTGMIYVAKILIESSELTSDDEQNASKKENKRTVFHLVLKASDSGSPQQSSVADLVIFLNDSILPSHMVQASQNLSISSTFIISVIGSLVGGILVLCCLVWGMFVYCKMSQKMSHKQGRLRNPQMGGMFQDEKYEKESNDTLDLCVSKPELGLSVKSLNSWQNNGRYYADGRILRNSMPNLQKNQAHVETTFVCRCSTTGLKSRLDAVDEVEKQKDDLPQSEDLHHSSQGHFHAPDMTGEHSSLKSRYDILTDCPGCKNLVQGDLSSNQHRHKKSQWPYRSDIDSDSTCSDSGRGLSEDERTKQPKKRSKHENHLCTHERDNPQMDRLLLYSSSFIPIRHKPQVSFRLSPAKPHQQQQLNLNPPKTNSQLVTNTLPLLKTRCCTNPSSDRSCQRDGHVWTRTLAGVTSEI